MEIAILVLLIVVLAVTLGISGSVSELDKRIAVWEAMSSKTANPAEESTDGDQRS